MGKSIYCPLCQLGYWSKDDKAPDQRPCPKCVKTHRLDNFYGLAKAILAQDITGIDERPVRNTQPAKDIP
jgi:hypothetical protein